jgi:hypothetical protein
MSPSRLAGFELTVGRLATHRWGIHHFCGVVPYPPLHRKVGLGA